MKKNIKVVAIIPARSGSKSIKDKNIQQIKKKPLLAWSIDCCKNSKQIDYFFVLTDSSKYQKIAKNMEQILHLSDQKVFLEIVQLIMTLLIIL